MKRRDLLEHLERNGCYFVREGAHHTVYCSGSSNRKTTVPRHVEVAPWLARKICKDLLIPPPKGKR